MLALLAVAAGPAGAEDSDRVRYYLGLRGQDTNPATGTHDAWGISLGANLGRYWGLELSADTFERFIDYQGHAVGEYGILALVPQVRLRYPLLDDRLVPYVVGGVGLGVTQFNDRKPRGFGLSIKNEDSTLLLGTVGGGIEYFFADNMAVGVEVKYIVAGDQTVTINGAPHDQQVESLLTMLSLRLFVPELRTTPLAEVRDSIPVRLYLGVRFGAAITTNSDVFDSSVVHPEPPAYGGEGNQFLGAALGLNFGRYWGVEMTAEGYEVRIADPALGSLGEMAVTTFIPHVRVRYPLWGGRLVPYLIGGVGLGYAEFNDRKPPGAGLDIDGKSFGVAAAGGAGIEYFVASNIAAGFEARYITSRGHTFRVGTGPEQDGHFDAVTLALTLRAFLVDFGGK
jgi:opacity protein-like surface antigen